MDNVYCEYWKALRAYYEARRVHPPTNGRGSVTTTINASLRLHRALDAIGEQEGEEARQRYYVMAFGTE